MLAGIRNALQTLQLRQGFKLILIPFIVICQRMGP